MSHYAQSGWRAIVIRDDSVTLHSGDELLVTPSTPLHPAEIITRAAHLFAGVGEGTVVWWPLTAESATTPAARKRFTDRILADLALAGWRTSERGAETGWFTCGREGEPYVHLGIGPWINPKTTPLFSPDDPPALIAERLARYHVATGAAWRMTAGMAGCAGIRAAYERRRPTGPDRLPRRTSMPLWRWDSAPDAVTGCSWEVRWDRELTPAECHSTYVHQFDIRASYLAAVGVARVAWSALHHAGPSLFEPSAAGYWQVRYGRRPGDLRKSGLVAGDMLIPPGRIDPRTDMIWLTTPVMAYLHERGVSPTVHDAWISSRTGTYLKTWSERIRDARWSTAPGAEQLLPALKATYARTVGAMSRPGGRVYRPDWRDTIVDTARVNLRRKIDAAARILGVMPLSVNLDSVYYADDDPDARMIRSALDAALTPTGDEPDRLGKFRRQRTYTMSEWMTEHRRRPA